MLVDQRTNFEQGPGPERSIDQLPSLASELNGRDMFCLHGIALDSVGDNSTLSDETTLEERFRIAIEDAPALSASVHTDRATTSKAALWSNVGVMIGEGKVQAASARDMSSVMLDEGGRKTPEQSTENMLTALDQIVANDGKYPDNPLHNEIVVKDPVVNGLYFKDTAGLMDYQVNRSQPTAEPGTVPELIRKVWAMSGLPIFAVRTSGMYRVDEFDPATGKYRFSLETTPRVHPAEVLPRPKSERIALVANRAVHQLVSF